MPFDELLAYAGTVTAITTVLVQLIKNAVFDGLVLKDSQRNAYLRLINYALNFGLLLVVVFTHGSFQAQDLIAYLGLALGQSVFSHAGFKVVSASSAPPTVQLTLPSTTSAAGSTSVDPGFGISVPPLPTIPNPNNG